MGRRASKNRKVSEKLKLFAGSSRLKSGQRLQRILSGRCGAWFLEPSGELHELESQECLKSDRVSKEFDQTQIEDGNDEFERDTIGF